MLSDVATPDDIVNTMFDAFDNVTTVIVTGPYGTTRHVAIDGVMFSQRLSGRTPATTVVGKDSNDVVVTTWP